MRQLTQASVAFVVAFDRVACTRIAAIALAVKSRPTPGAVRTPEASQRSRSAAPALGHDHVGEGLEHHAVVLVDEEHALGRVVDRHAAGVGYDHVRPHAAEQAHQRRVVGGVDALAHEGAAVAQALAGHVAGRRQHPLVPADAPELQVQGHPAAHARPGQTAGAIRSRIPASTALLVVIALPYPAGLSFTRLGGVIFLECYAGQRGHSHSRNAIEQGRFCKRIIKRRKKKHPMHAAVEAAGSSLELRAVHGVGKFAL